VEAKMDSEAYKKTVNLLVLRATAKLEACDTQIFFQEKRDPVTGQRLGIKEPVTLFINNTGDFYQYPLECVQCVVVRLDEPTWSYVCGKKVKVSVGFKVMLLVKYSGSESYELITLPDDIGIKCTTLYDLSEKQVSHSIYQTMQRVGDKFIYTMVIDLSDFSGVIPGDDFKVVALFRNMTWSAEIGEVGYDGTSSPPVPATRVDLAIFYDILVQLVVEEEITVNGMVE
jgi:hypothetical protein